jgi:hypothetical protein
LEGTPSAPNPPLIGPALKSDLHFHLAKLLWNFDSTHLRDDSPPAFGAWCAKYRYGLVLVEEDTQSGDVGPAE